MKSNTNSSAQQLYELLCCLHQIGKELPQLLIQLASIANAQLPKERIIPILGKMFEDVPGLLHQHEQQPLNPQLQTIFTDPPSELITVRLLLSLRELHQLIEKISVLQLLHLSNNFLHPGPHALQVEFMQKAQEIFQTWTQEIIQSHHQILSETPLHMERQQLLRLEPKLPWELLHLILELLKLPLDEILHFKEWMSKLPRKQLIMLVQLLQMEPSSLLELKQRMDALSFASHNATSSTNDANPQDTSSIETNHALGNYQYQLRIARQPPTRTVYQRILKPFPAVMLVDTNPSASDRNNLFVEVSLLRGDSEVEIPLCMEGNRIVRITNGSFATFNKLKLLATSQQQGTLFRLKFVLKRYVNNVFEHIPNVYVISNPIQVFSHTQYLPENTEDAPPPPAIHEVVPPTGGVGTRVAILGSNFINSPNLLVRFGDIDIQASFHEQGTLLCNIPSLSRSPGLVPVRVSNDRLNFCETKVFFNYQPNTPL